MSADLLFCVFDRVAQRYLPPILAPTVDAAKRMMASAVNGRDQNLTQYPGDYDLYHVGAMDTASGVVEGAPPVHVCRAVDLVDKSKVSQ